MFLNVHSNTWKFEQNRNSNFVKNILLAYTGQLEDLRRFESTRETIQRRTLAAAALRLAYPAQRITSLVAFTLRVFPSW